MLTLSSFVLFTFAIRFHQIYLDNQQSPLFSKSNLRKDNNDSKIKKILKVSFADVKRYVLSNNWVKW